MLIINCNAILLHRIKFNFAVSVESGKLIYFLDSNEIFAIIC